MFISLLFIAAVTAAPRIDKIVPHGVRRGTQFDLHLYGPDLLDPQDMVFYESGLELVEFDAIQPNHVVARIAVADDCRLGPNAFRLVTGRGLSNLRTFSVSALAVVNEVEPNNTTDVATTVTLPATLHGILGNEDEDCFAVELVEGQSVTLEVEGVRMGRERFDPFLEVIGPDGKSVAENDDFMLTQQDPLCSFKVAKAGKHIIHVRDVRYHGNDKFHYVVHVGDFPRPVVAIPTGGKPGEELEVTWKQPGLEDWTQKLRLPDNASQRELHSYGMFATNEQGVAPTANQLRVVDLPNFVESGDNGKPSTGMAVTIPAAIHGAIRKPNETDHFKFTAKKGQVFELRVFARRVLRSPLDPLIAVRNVKTRKQVVSNDDSGGPDCYAEFTIPEDGEYYVLIRDHLRRGGEDYFYRMEVQPRKSRLTLGLPERRQYISTIVNIPRGGRMAVLVTTQRKHFNEAVEMALGDLPSGLTATLPPIPKGRDRVPVLIEAAAEVNRGGHLLALTGTAKVGDKSIQGRLFQRTMLVRGQNNRDVWGHDAERMAVAITDESPFSIEVVPPKSPLVRNGERNLHVVAKRKDGFNELINVRMIYNPPGVSSRGQVTIPKGQDAVDMPLTANGGAAIGVSPVVLTATANFQGSSYEVSSQLVDLEVADSFFKANFAKASVEQGQETDLVVTLEPNREYPGDTHVELVGLPAGTSSEAQDITGNEKQELTFRIKAEPKARPGRFNTVYCRITVKHEDEQVINTLGRGQLRVDKPLPPKKDTNDKNGKQPKVAKK